MFNSLFLKTQPFDFVAIFSNIEKRWYYYVLLAVVLIALCIFAYKGKQNRNNLTSTQKLVYIAILSALAFLANYFTFKASDLFQISFVALVGFLAGYLLGGVGGFAVSFIGDFICGIVMPFGAYNPIIGIGTGLWGFVPGIIFTYFKGNDYIKTIISFAICFVLNSFLVNTFGLSIMYGMSFDSLLILLPGKLLTVVGNMICSLIFVGVLPRVLPKDKFFITTNQKDEQTKVINE